MSGAADQLDYAVTKDGWRLALHRFFPRPGHRRRHPVVCCHGLGANHVAFDVATETSLARHLARRGYPVTLVDLRGHGDSDRPALRGDKRFGWSFDDYLTRDLPAVIEAVAAAHDAEQVHWIGHSMGGLLLYAHLARGARSTIRSGIAVGSSLDYSGTHSGFHGMLALRPLLRALPAVPVGGIARLSSRFVGRVTTPYERFNVWPSNCEPALWRRICERGFHAVSPPVMSQLSSAMQEGGLRSQDGRVRYLERLRDSETPVLSLAGDRDAQCPPQAAEQTISVLRRGELRVFGKAHGQADHYGHFDLLIGRRVRDEVFPHIDAWLDRWDEG